MAIIMRMEYLARVRNFIYLPACVIYSINSYYSYNIDRSLASRETSLE